MLKSHKVAFVKMYCKQDFLLQNHSFWPVAVDYNLSADSIRWSSRRQLSLNESYQCPSLKTALKGKKEEGVFAELPWW